MNEKIAVVIPAHNEEKTIADTLDAVCGQSRPADAIIVVDNASTDSTARIIEKYAQTHASVILLSEPRKGTGFACDAGFRYAIDVAKASVICRTDADSVPNRRWLEEFADYLSSHPEKELVSGPLLPKDDEFHRWYDDAIWRPYWKFVLASGAVVRREPFLLRYAFGGNLAIRSRAYDAVGGFTHTDISENDEDHSLNRDVYRRYGLRGIGIARGATVRTSTRRIRKIGYLGIVPYYAFSDKHGRLEKTDGVIDIR